MRFASKTPDPFDVPQTTTVTMGGRGRPVVGRVTIPAWLAGRTDWSYFSCMVIGKSQAPKLPMPDEIKNASLARQAQWLDAFEASDAGKTYSAALEKDADVVEATKHGFDVQSDGSFRVEDIVAGDYKLSFDILQKKVGDAPRKQLGAGEAEFTVPPMAEGRSDEPLDVGPVEIHSSNSLQAGELAPDFSVKRFDSGDVKLSDFRGKYVLLDFWATWCGPCIGEIPTLQEIHRRFGGDPRFVMVSLSLDPRPNDPIRFIAKNDLAWEQGFLGDWDSAPVINDYGVLGIPSMWLIDPNGKVIVRNLTDEPLISAVARALGRASSAP